MASAIGTELHESVKSRLIGRIHLAPEGDETAVAAAATPLVEAEERRREEELVQAVHDAVGARARGVGGAEKTLTALQSGQVMTLVINDDLSGAAWADFSLPLYGVGALPNEHPAGGDHGNLVAVELADVLLYIASQTDADIELVQTTVPVSLEEQTTIPDEGQAVPRSRAAQDLDAFGGVGAILRFALDDNQPTANL